MKNIIILLGFFCFTFFSCKKDENTSTPDTRNSGKKSYIKFNLTGFSQKVEALPNARQMNTSVTARDTVLGRKAKYLYLGIYNASTNELVKSSYQRYPIDSANFGVFADSLEIASYVLVAAASPDTLLVAGGNSLSTARLSGTYLRYPEEIRPWNDLFVKRYAFHVDSDTETFDLELNRVIARLDVRLSDATYPFYKVAAEMLNVFDEFNLNNVLPSQANTTPPGIKMTQVSDTTFSNFILNTSSAFSVKITVTNTMTGIVVSKTVDNVRCYANRRTIISGRIQSFDPNLPFGIPDLNIKVDDQWETGGPVYNY